MSITAVSTATTQQHGTDESDAVDTDISGSEEQSPVYGRSMYNHSPTVAEYMSMLLESDNENIDNDISTNITSSPRPLTRAMRAMSDSQAPGRRIYHGDVPIESLSDDEAVPLAQSALQFLTHTNRTMTPRKTTTQADAESSNDSSANKSYTTVSTTSMTSSDASHTEITTVPIDTQNTTMTISVTTADNGTNAQSDTVVTTSITTSPQLPPFHSSVTAVAAHTSPLQSSPVFGSLPGFADVALNTPSPVVPMITPSLNALTATPHFLSRDLKSHDNLHSVMSLHGRNSPSIFNRTPGFSPRLASLTSPTLMSNLVKNPLDLKQGNKSSPTVGPTLSAYLGPIGKTYADGTMTAGVHSTSPNSNSGKLSSIVHTSPTMISSAFLKSPIITHRNGTMSGGDSFKLVSIKSENVDDTNDSNHTFSLMNRLKQIHSQHYRNNNDYVTANGKRMKLEGNAHITPEQSAEYENKLRNLSVGNAMMPINTPVLGSNVSHINKHLQSMSASPDLNALQQTDAGLLSALKHQAAMIDVEVETSNNDLHGLRCHQCKLKRSVENIAFCCNSNNTGKKLMTNNARICRNKYCDLCLLKYYSEVAPEMSRRKIDGYINISNTWSCPSCRGLCCCNGCKKLRRRIDPTAQQADVTKFSPAMLVAYSMVYYPDELNNIEQHTNHHKPTATTTINGVNNSNTSKSNSQQNTPKLTAANGTTKSEPNTSTKPTNNNSSYPFNYTASSTTSSTTSSTSSYPYNYGTNTATVGSTSSTSATYPYSYINGLRTNSAASTSSHTASYPYNYYAQSNPATSNTSTNGGTAAALQQTVPSAIVTAYPGYSYEPKTQNYLFTANNLITYLYSTVKKDWVVYTASEAALCSATNSSTTSGSTPSKMPINNGAVANKPITPNKA